MSCKWLQPENEIRCKAKILEIIPWLVGTTKNGGIKCATASLN